MGELRELLDRNPSAPLLRAGERRLTRGEFAARVDKLARRLRSAAELDPAHFVLLEEEDPIRFFSLLVALLEENRRVVFPTRDHLAGRARLDFHRDSVSLPGDSLTVSRNPAYRAVPGLDLRGDVVLFSSGSTGSPKGILHPKSHLLANARAVSRRMPPGPYSSATLLMPYLVSALCHFLVHLLGESELVFLPAEELESLSRLYREAPRTAFVGSPMHLLMGASAIGPGADPAFFFSSGDFIYANKIAELLARFPKSKFYLVYGLAELAGRFFVNEIDAASPAGRLGSVGTNIDGTRYRIEDGALFVESDFLYLGYIVDGNYAPRSGAHPSGDLAREEGGLVYLQGRSNDQVKVGGNKVSLKHIERAVSELLVDDVCVVVPSEHRLLGTVIALVLCSKRDYRRSELLGRIKERLQPHELPHLLYRIDKVPYTQTMKIDRRAVQGALGTLKAIL